MKNLMELFTFGILLQEAISDSLSDKKINLLDFPKFIGVITSAGPAFTDVEAVREEIKNLDEAGRAKLYAFIQEKFDLADDAKEELIEETIKCLLDIYALAVKWSSFRKPETV